MKNQLTKNMKLRRDLMKGRIPNSECPSRREQCMLIRPSLRKQQDSIRIQEYRTTKNKERQSGADRITLHQGEATHAVRDNAFPVVQTDCSLLAKNKSSGNIPQLK